MELLEVPLELLEVSMELSKASMELLKGPMELLEVPIELLEVSRNHFKTNQELFVNEKLRGSGGDEVPLAARSLSQGGPGRRSPPGKKEKS